MEAFDAFVAAVTTYIRVSGAKKVLFHCHAGLNRSAFVLAQYLAYTGDGELGTIEDIIALIQEKRSLSCLFNRLFVSRLHEWYGEKML